MNEKVAQTYLITVEKTMQQTLDLLTRKREFALLETGQRLSPQQEEVLQSANCVWIEIRDAVESVVDSQTKRCKYLVVSLEGHAFSRDALPAAEMLPNSEFGACLRELMRDGSAEASPVSIRALYELCEGKRLVADLASESEEKANKFWLRSMLRLGMDPGKWYASDDFSSIKVILKRVSSNPESETAEESKSCDEPVPVDISEFEVCDCLCSKLEHSAEGDDYGYPNDVFVEYSICSDELVARCCATEFYSNHCWNWDPANLLVLRFCAEIASDECTQRDVQFSHPTKVTRRKADGERFLVDSMVMTNAVKTKFTSGRGDDKRPDEAVSADRVMDNLVDFYSWVDMHRKEIELL